MYVVMNLCKFGGDRRRGSQVVVMHVQLGVVCVVPCWPCGREVKIKKRQTLRMEMITCVNFQMITFSWVNNPFLLLL